MALLRAKAYTPINEIASAFGFKHMGQYSRDYRRWFGETPSMTLMAHRSHSSAIGKMRRDNPVYEKS